MCTAHFNEFCDRCTMERCQLFAFSLLAFITIADSSDPNSFKKSVTGYRGEDITLDCKLLTGHLIQVDWHWTSGNNNVKTKIALNDPQIGPIFYDSPLKEKLVFSDDSSLTIKNVEMNDTGTYTCVMTTFPSGSFERDITLTVLDPPQSSGVIIRIVISVLLLIITMTTITYVFIARKRTT
ncbi:hypothetical protein UPYG_G00152640 [Umbra pygmaea]|uniref:Ig-like domain-containing protein n=1 Tax=Umbra pygmaea TaxID=75934 RepID=A0ABD0XM84_UMBPY